MSKNDSREPRLRNYAEVLAQDLRPGHLAEVWTEETRAYVFRRVTRVERSRDTGKPRVEVCFEGIPLSREYMPGDRFRITPESYEQVRRSAPPAGKGEYAEIPARDLRPGYEALTWSRKAGGYVPRRIIRVDLKRAPHGDPVWAPPGDRVWVWYQDLAGKEIHEPGARVRITTGSFEQVQAQVHGDGVPPGCPHAGARQSPCPVCAPPEPEPEPEPEQPARQVFATCRWGGHMLHRDAGADAAPWLDKEGRRYCPRRPTGPVPPGLPGGHQPAPPPEPAGEYRFYATCRWGGHRLHRESDTGTWKDDCGGHTCPDRPVLHPHPGHEPVWEKPAPHMARLAAAAREAQEELAAKPPGYHAATERDLVGAARRSLETLRKIAGEPAVGSYQWRQAEEAIYGTLSTALDAGYWEGRAAGAQGRAAEARRELAPEPDYLALAAKAAPRWGICPHGCFHRASHTGVCVECGCPTSTLVAGSFSRAAQASTAGDRMEAAVDAAMAAFPCSCDAEGTSAGTVHEPHCDTQIPPDVVRRMHEAWLRHLAAGPPSAPQKPAPGTRGDSDADYLRARLRAAAARERAAQHQATSSGMHSHDGLTLHSHAVRPDHQGVDQADGKGQK